MHIKPIGPRIEIGDLEFSEAHVIYPVGGDPRFPTDFGYGIAYFQGGEYKGYFSLPEEYAGLPLDEIIETDEFKEKYSELTS